MKAPPTEWAINEEVPLAKPLPNYKGPFTKPYAGFYLKAWIPVEIFLNKPIGLPIIFKDPKIL